MDAERWNDIIKKLFERDTYEWRIFDNDGEVIYEGKITHIPTGSPESWTSDREIFIGEYPIGNRYLIGDIEYIKKIENDE